MIRPQLHRVIDVPDDLDAVPEFKSRRLPGEVVEVDASEFHCFAGDPPPTDAGFRGAVFVPRSDTPRSNAFDRNAAKAWFALGVLACGLGAFVATVAVVWGGQLAQIIQRVAQ